MRFYLRYHLNYFSGTVYSTYFFVYKVVSNVHLGILIVQPT